MSVEHASVRIIDGYARGGADLAADEVWALESHLETCPTCRVRLSDAVATGAPDVVSLVDTVWSEVAPRLDPAATMRARRKAAGVSVRLPARSRSALWRWLTPAMAPWLAMAVAVTLTAYVLDTFDDGIDDVSVLLLLAPVLPVLGVAASWSRGLDPAYELTAAAPRAGLELVLRRTASVLAVVVPAQLLVGGATGVSVAQWLLPCLAFTSATLALGGVVGVTRAAAALVVVWSAAVLAPTLATGRTAAALDADALPGWALLLTLGTGVVVARRGAYSVLGAHR
ncbi:zf-HC2 domain-containing protein [Streptomyces sp. Z26]|uniref:zf-HC2 domain-containing protein n=1 Tax=Streptomyces sp. Z26 TaxID=2500177 RepID=UPI000EF15C49|nr:zf-HC2 domain-containing protein [Streptomyces sp. Z26]RLL67238.1 zf-HC2 domain-containing protein [Streptomyces sp. Z26]